MAGVLRGGPLFLIPYILTHLFLIPYILTHLFLIPYKFDPFIPNPYILNPFPHSLSFTDNLLYIYNICIHSFAYPSVNFMYIVQSLKKQHHLILIILKYSGFSMEAFIGNE